MSTPEQQRILAMLPNVRRIVYSVFRLVPAYIDRDDMIQAGMVGVCAAGKKWNPTMGVFATYVSYRAIGAIKDHLNRERGMYRRKHTDGSVERLYPPDMVSLTEYDPAPREEVTSVWSVIERTLTSTEYSTLGRWLAGYSEIEIARQDGVTGSAISRRLTSIREKLAPILRPNYRR